VMIASSVVMAAPVSAQMGGQGGGGAGQGGGGAGGGGQQGSGDQGGGGTANQGGGSSNPSETGTGAPTGGQQSGAQQSGQQTGNQQGGQVGGQGPSGGQTTGQGGQAGQGSPGGQMGGPGGTGQGGQMGGGMMGGGMMGGPNVQMGPMMGGMRASFSCGTQAGMYGMNNLDEDMFPGGGETVPGLFYQIQYTGLPATTIGVIRYYNDEQSFQAVQRFTVQGGNGSIESSVMGRLAPEAQGGEGSLARAQGRADGPVTSQRTRGGSSASGYGGGGGLMPGEYIFDVFTGETRQTTEGPMFVADPAGFLGRFTCGVQD